MPKNLPPQEKIKQICWLSKKKYKYKTLEMRGGWAQSNQKIIDVTWKKVKNNYNHIHENLPVPWYVSILMVIEHVVEHFLTLQSRELCKKTE